MALIRRRWLLLLALSACGVTTPQEDCAASCTTGCCDNTGACQAGTSGFACGQGGLACEACALGQTCVLGRCVLPAGAGGGMQASGGGGASGTGGGDDATGGGSANTGGGSSSTGGGGSNTGGGGSNTGGGGSNTGGGGSNTGGGGSNTGGGESNTGGGGEASGGGGSTNTGGGEASGGGASTGGGTSSTGGGAPSCSCSSNELCSAGQCLWDDVSLAGLTVDGQPVTVDPSTSLAISLIALNATQATVTASTLPGARGTLRVGGTLTSSGGAKTIPLYGADEVVSIVVTAESGRQASYTLLLSVPALAQQVPTYVKASNPDGLDRFGLRLALSADGDTLAIGATGEASGSTSTQSDNTKNKAGAVYVFHRTGSSTWTQQAYLKAALPGSLQYFGLSLALDATGNTLVVGAVGDSSSATGVNGNQSDTSAFFAGAAWVFTRAGTTWTRAAYLKASNTGAGDGFGAAVAITADGQTIAVAAEDEDGTLGTPASNGCADSGAVYVFSRAGGTFNQTQYLKAPTCQVSGNFGIGLAFGGGGAVLAVGEPADRAVLDAVGAVYVFRRGTSWTQEAKLQPVFQAPGAHFGASVAVSDDGVTLIGGAPAENGASSTVNGDATNQSLQESGAAYVFTRGATSWTQQAYLKAQTPGLGDRFGASVALTGTGDQVFVGAPAESSAGVGLGSGLSFDDSAPNAGAAYAFTRGPQGWLLGTYIKATNTGPGDALGVSLACSADGATLAFGAPGEASGASGINGNQASNASPEVGAVYLWQ